MLLNRRNDSSHSGFDEHLDMTAMVDVVFQLMTFLLLTYQASVEAAVDMPQSHYGVGIEETETILLTVAPPPEGSETAPVFLGGELDPKARLDDDDAIKAAVQSGLVTGKRRVVIQADGVVPYGEVLRVAADAGSVEGLSVHIGVKEPK